MDEKLYNNILEFKRSGKLPEGSRYAKYRFARHYNNYNLSNGNGLMFNNTPVIVLGKVEEVLSKLYKDPKTTSNGKYSFFKSVTDRFHGITFKQVSDFLDKQENYQLHKPSVKIHVVKPIIKNSPDMYFQVDLIDMQQYEYWNGGNRYILTAIDLFAKRAHAYAIKDKTGLLVAGAFKKIIEIVPNIRTLQSDNGSEFISNEFESLLKSHGIRHMFSRSHTPQSQGAIEKFNQTLKRLIFSHFTQYNTKVWVDVLPSLIENYNNRYHSSIKIKPSEVSNRNKKEVKQHIKDAVKGTTIYNNRLNKSNGVKVGDKVRLLISAVNSKVRAAQLTGIGQASKQYKELWTRQVYVVQSIRSNAGVKYIKVDGLNVSFRINEIQIIDFDKTIPANSKHSDLDQYNIDSSQFKREENIEKLAKFNTGRGLESKVDKSEYNLRARKKISYKI